MLSEIVKPNKSQLIRKLNNLKNPKIEIFEVFDDNSKNNLIRKLGLEIRKGNFSIVMIKN